MTGDDSDTEEKLLPDLVRWTWADEFAAREAAAAIARALGGES